MKEFFMGLCGMILLSVIIFGLQALSFGSFMFWKPKYENANRQIFENTKSFRDGNARDLDNLRLAYLQAKTPEDRAILKDAMRHRALGIPRDQISPEINAIIYGAN